MKIKNDPELKKKRAEQHRKWVKKNKEHYNEYMRNQMKIKSPIYYQKHKEKKQKYARRYARVYYAKNKELIIKRRKEWKVNSTKEHNNYIKKHAKLFGMTPSQYSKSLLDFSKTIKKERQECAICGSKKELHIHHLIYKKTIPELTFRFNNCIILCKKHHKEIH